VRAGKGRERGREKANNPEPGQQHISNRKGIEIFQLLRKFLLFYMRNNHRPQ